MDKEPSAVAEQSFIVFGNEKYFLSIPEKEEQLEKLVKEHANSIFGTNFSYFDIKKSIKTKSDVCSLPDGYAISPTNDFWYVVEVELASHDPYKHIIPQITKFSNGVANHDNQKIISDCLYTELKANQVLISQFNAVIKDEIHFFLSNLVAKKPKIVIIVDEVSSRLQEACRCLNPTPIVIEFKTFTSGGQHAHFVSKPLVAPELPSEPALNSLPPSDKIELEDLRQKMENMSKILKEAFTLKLELLNSGEDITNLQINNDLLDKIYFQALKEAKETGYHDARLYSFNVIVTPFSNFGKVAILLDFYSEMTKKEYSFIFFDRTGILERNLPDKARKFNMPFLASMNCLGKVAQSG